MVAGQRAAVGTDPGRSLTVGLVQTGPVFGAVDANLARIGELLDELGPVDLALTAELSIHGYPSDSDQSWPTLDPTDPRLQQWPGRAGAVGVGFAEHRPEGKPHNTYAVIGAEGTDLQRKLHPVSYAPWNEHHTFAPGSELRTFAVAGARCATVICNDMWHPVAPWVAAHAGAEVIIAPVASLSGPDPAAIARTWEVIIEQTARVFQGYVVFVNQCGSDPGLEFWGGSRILGPDGAELARLGGSEGVVAADLDLDAVQAARTTRPFHHETNLSYLETALSEHRRQRIGDHSV